MLPKGSFTKDRMVQGLLVIYCMQGNRCNSALGINSGINREKVSRARLRVLTGSCSLAAKHPMCSKKKDPGPLMGLREKRELGEEEEKRFALQRPQACARVGFL